ncbi:MAG: lipid A deacylase LpxR family protein [Nitrosomonadales bacterium]|nr:lipid A deacylase LpxR family protein [Nitrosomonadales bacterium]
MLIQWRTAGLVLLGMTLPLVSVAETSNQTLNDELHPFGKKLQFQFQWENDSMLPFNKISETDRWYTQGIKFAWVYSKPKEDSNLANRVGNWWCDKNTIEESKSCKDSLAHGFMIGQNMYTPANIKIAAPQPNDRPWAGWLYGNRFVVLSSPEDTEKPEIKERFDLTIGVTGPLSHAEQVQKEWHKDVVHAPTPMGWDNQLKNEVGVNVAYQKRSRVSHHIAATDFDWDTTSIYGGYFGTVLIAPKVGGEFRIGRNLQHYGNVDGRRILPDPPQPMILAPDGIESNAPPASKPETKMSEHIDVEPYYFFAGVELRAVARNLFLDGNLFGSSPSIHKKTLVYDVWAGASWRITKKCTITYKQVGRSPDFDTPAGQAAFQKFSVFTLTHEFM